MPPAKNPHPGAIHLLPTQEALLFRCTIEGGRTVVTSPVSESPTKAKGGFETVTQTKTTTDNVAEYAKAEEFVAQSIAKVNELSHQNPIMPRMIATEARPAAEAKLNEIIKAAAKLNKSLTACKVNVGYYFASIQLAITPAIVKAVSDDVRGKLEGLKGALQNADGKFEEAPSAFSRVREVASQVTGMPADSIKYALEEARAVIKSGKPARADEPLSAIEGAIDMFTPVDQSTIPEL